MAPCSIPRFQFSRELSSLSIYPGRIPHAPAWRLHWCRKASTNSPPLKPRVLEKPTKFYPPSHPPRLAKRILPRQYPGPPLSEAQKREQGTKKYPNTMPAEGTFMYWFLNSRLLHMSITLVIRTSSLGLVAPALSNTFHRVYSSPLPLSCSLKIFTGRPHLLTVCLLPESSGRIPSNSWRPTDMSTNSIRIMSVRKPPRGVKRRWMMCKSAVAIAKLMAWKMSKAWEAGLPKLIMIPWVQHLSVKTYQIRSVLLRAGRFSRVRLQRLPMMVNRRTRISKVKNDQSRSGWVSGSEAVSSKHLVLLVTLRRQSRPTRDPMSKGLGSQCTQRGHYSSLSKI